MAKRRRKRSKVGKARRRKTGKRRAKKRTSSNRVPLRVLDARARRLKKTPGGRYLISKIKELY